MKKAQIVMAALVTLLALSAALATTASAEATLLAEWLIKGMAVTTLTSVTLKKTKFLIEDKTFGAAIECEINDGWSVGDDGEGEETVVSNSKGEEVTLAKPVTLTTGCKIVSGCNTADAVEFAPEGLPSHWLLFLMELTNTYLVHQFKKAYSMTCTILGIKATDECTFENAEVEVLAGTEGAELTGALTPNGNCSVGGAGAGDGDYPAPNNLVDLTNNPVVPSST